MFQLISLPVFQTNSLISCLTFYFIKSRVYVLFIIGLTSYDCLFLINAYALKLRSCFMSQVSFRNNRENSSCSEKEAAQCQTTGS